MNEQNPRARPLMRDMDKNPANKKVMSVMSLSLCEADRKQFKDKYPHTRLWDLGTEELITMCNECPREIGIEGYTVMKFLPELQQPGE